MSSYSVADAKNGLPALIDRALAGEDVVITRHGKPVAELRPLHKPRETAAYGSHAWLKAQREARPGIGMTSVELLDDLYNEPRE
jgi:prevent-host-death family protein